MQIGAVFMDSKAGSHHRLTDVHRGFACASSCSEDVMKGISYGPSPLKD